MMSTHVNTRSQEVKSRKEKNGGVSGTHSQELFCSSQASDDITIHILTVQAHNSVIIFGPDLEPNNTDSAGSSINPSASSESELSSSQETRQRHKDPV